MPDIDKHVETKLSDLEKLGVTISSINAQMRLGWKETEIPLSYEAALDPTAIVLKRDNDSVLTPCYNFLKSPWSLTNVSDLAPVEQVAFTQTFENFDSTSDSKQKFSQEIMTKQTTSYELVKELSIEVSSEENAAGIDMGVKVGASLEETEASSTEQLETTKVELDILVPAGQGRRIDLAIVTTAKIYEYTATVGLGGQLGLQYPKGTDADKALAWMEKRNMNSEQLQKAYHEQQDGLTEGRIFYNNASFLSDGKTVSTIVRKVAKVQNIITKEVELKSKRNSTSALDAQPDAPTEDAVIIHGTSFNPPETLDIPLLELETSARMAPAASPNAVPTLRICIASMSYPPGRQPIPDVKLSAQMRLFQSYTLSTLNMSGVIHEIAVNKTPQAYELYVRFDASRYLTATMERHILICSRSVPWDQSLIWTCNTTDAPVVAPPPPVIKAVNRYAVVDLGYPDRSVPINVVWPQLVHFLNIIREGVGSPNPITNAYVPNHSARWRLVVAFNTLLMNEQQFTRFVWGCARKVTWTHGVNLQFAFSNDSPLKPAGWNLTARTVEAANQTPASADDDGRGEDLAADEDVAKHATGFESALEAERIPTDITVAIEFTGRHPTADHMVGPMSGLHLLTRQSDKMGGILGSDESAYGGEYWLNVVYDAQLHTKTAIGYYISSCFQKIAWPVPTGFHIKWDSKGEELAEAGRAAEEQEASTMPPAEFDQIISEPQIKNQSFPLLIDLPDIVDGPDNDEHVPAPNPESILAAPAPTSKQSVFLNTRPGFEASYLSASLMAFGVSNFPTTAALEVSYKTFQSLVIANAPPHAILACKVHRMNLGGRPAYSLCLMFDKRALHPTPMSDLVKKCGSQVNWGVTKPFIWIEFKRTMGPPIEGLVAGVTALAVKEETADRVAAPAAPAVETAEAPTHTITIFNLIKNEGIYPDPAEMKTCMDTFQLLVLARAKTGTVLDIRIMQHPYRGGAALGWALYVKWDMRPYEGSGKGAGFKDLVKGCLYDIFWPVDVQLVTETRSVARRA